MNEVSRQNIRNGYGHLIRDAIRSRADNIRDELYPEYYTGVHGIIISKGSVRLLLKERNNQTYNNDVTKMFYFKSMCCSCLSDDDNRIFCSECEKQIPFLKRKCIDAVRMRLEGVTHAKTNNKYLYHSPSLISNKVDRLAQNIKMRTSNNARVRPR